MPGIFDIIGGGASLAGLGLEIAGIGSERHAAQEEQAAQSAMIGTEMQQDAVRRQAMELQAQRQNMQMLRNAQQARSVALAAAVSSGSQFSSSYGGAQGQISGQEGTQLLGLSQNLEQGREMFDLSKQLSQEKIQYASAQTDMANAQGLMGLGQGLMSGGNMFTKMFGGPS